MPTDWTDHHLTRWRDHWIDIDFDDNVEGIVVRIARLRRYLKNDSRRVIADVGLQDFEYETLHQLMIRDTPGTASPTDLAEQLGVSAAGMTGRLDGLQQAGLVQRTPSLDDRRRVVVEITKQGADLWRRAMSRRGAAEADVVGVLSEREQATLNRLLRKLAAHAEAAGLG